MRVLLLRSGTDLLDRHECAGPPRALLAVLRARLLRLYGERSATTLTLPSPAQPLQLRDDVGRLAPVVTERAGRAQVVHALDLVAAAAALAARRATGLPVVVRDQPAVRQQAAWGTSNHVAWSAVLRAADGVVVPTPADAHAAQGAGVDPARVMICPDGALVAGAQCATLPAGPARATSDRYLLGLSGVPDHACVREGLVMALRRDRTLRLVLAGARGPLGPRDAMLGLARRHGCEDRVEVYPPLASGQVLELVDAAAAVVPTRSDPSSALSALVAMRRARPVVGVRSVADSDALVEGVTGRLVDPNQPRLLADALVETAGDRFRQLSWGLAGLDRVASRYDSDAVMAAMVKAYERAA